MSEKRRRVVYLFGAGASHACVKAVGSDRGVLMRDLGPDLANVVHERVEDHYKAHPELVGLANEVVDDETDYEHLITFLDQSSSAIHREFAEDLRRIFERVLKQKLVSIHDELGRHPTDLYEALLDMYEHPKFGEDLGGLLTINYDEYIEQAIESFVERRVDFGIAVEGKGHNGTSIRLLKLHGSFGWTDTWPISASQGDENGLWIPPGIQKAKDRYPFNTLWGLAREMLNCDVLRVIGCRLSPNDWDLISLLFSTRLTHTQGREYVIEVIDAPLHAHDLATDFPYLGIRSLFELDQIGPQLVSEFTGGGPRPFGSLSEIEQQEVRANAGKGHNWFRLWLTQMAEAIYREYGSVDTPKGRLKAFLEA